MSMSKDLIAPSFLTSLPAESRNEVYKHLLAGSEPILVLDRSSRTDLDHFQLQENDLVTAGSQVAGVALLQICR